MKRKIIIPIALSVCFVCASCKTVKNAESPDLSGNITLSGRLTCEGIAAEVDLERCDNIWTVCFTSPDSVKGLTVTDDGTNVKYSLDGIEYNYSENSPQFTTAAELITSCIDNAGATENVTVKQGNDGLTLSGTADKNGYTLTLDANGEIVGVSVGGYVLDCSGDPAPETTAPTADVAKYLK